MKAMIFAAGLGTRLRPLTDTLPKALVPVGGRPLLEIQIRKLMAAGVTDIVINVHHFAEQIVRFVEDNHSFGIRITFSDETDALLETGGAIRQAAPLLLDGMTDDEPFLIHNVDILSNADLGAFCREARGGAAELLVSERPTQRYLLFDDADRLVGWTNVQTGEVRTPYPRLKVADCRRYAFAGIQLMSTRLFPYFETWPRRFSIIDFYLTLCHQEAIYARPCADLRLLDVGKLDTLARAEAFLDGC